MRGYYDDGAIYIILAIIQGLPPICIQISPPSPFRRDRDIVTYLWDLKQ